MKGFWQTMKDGGKDLPYRPLAVIRALLLQRDGPLCCVCGLPMDFTEHPNHHEGSATIEHLNELALGGGWAPDNLALSHRRCNRWGGRLTQFILRWELFLGGGALIGKRHKMPAWPALPEEFVNL